MGITVVLVAVLAVAVRAAATLRAVRPDVRIEDAAYRLHLTPDLPAWADRRSLRG